MKHTEPVETGTQAQALAALSERLFALQDTAYRAFQSKLMPTVPPEMKQQLRGLRVRARKV